MNNIPSFMSMAYEENMTCGKRMVLSKPKQGAVVGFSGGGRPIQANMQHWILVATIVSEGE